MDKTNRYGVVTEETIDIGHATDAYFVRTEDALDEAGRNPKVVAEVTADQFSTGQEEIFVGVENVIELLTNVSVDMYALPEGSRFDGGPVMRIEGNYRDFARYETALLGMLSEPSGYATKARELATASRELELLSFGSRHNHPATAAILERAAYIGGVDGYSNLAAQDDVPVEPSGTMPHALMLSMQETEAAWNAYNDAFEDDVPRIVLADTFTDEVEEAKRACRVLEDDLDGIRLDTTSSRRGDFKSIIKEVRYELDAIGRDDVDIYVSGGLGVREIRNLRRVVDGFGVGSAISDAPSVDFGLDIVQVNGNNISKRGKLPGVKETDGFEQFIDDGLPVNSTNLLAARHRAEYGNRDDLSEWVEEEGMF